MPLPLHQHKVGELPSLYYIPDYVTHIAEERILREVRASKAKWVQLSGRRLQNHGGVVHNKGLLPAPLPSWLEQLVAQLHADTGIYGDAPPNHVLINAYQPGDGIMPHQDGPLYHPGVAILSTGSPTVLRFWRKLDPGGTGGAPPEASVLLQPRSLVVFTDEAYTCCLHGIDEVCEERLDPSIVNLHLCGGSRQPSTDAAANGSRPAHTPSQSGAVAGNEAAAASTAAGAAEGLLVPGRHVSAESARAMGRQVGAESAGAQGAGACQQSAELPGAELPGLACPSAHDVLLARTGERVSLTVRRVLRVYKGLSLGSLGARK